ncbi:MAG: VCBS repeat-containing protein [Planctomycetota bacterium]|nr:VCBS repeat-containing protein [Planctomycetota bacterium]
MRSETSVGVTVVATCGLAIGLAQPALGQQGVEISEDGWRSAVVDAGAPSSGWVSRTSRVPFGTAPGWTLTLRRQVGAVRIADLNADGRNDLFVGCYISNSSPPYDAWRDLIFFNTPAGLPLAPQWTSADQIHTGDAQIGDINGDGKLDIFAISGGTAFSPVRVYFGASDNSGPSTSPGWTATPPRAGWSTGGLLFDADNDGDLDAFVTNQGLSPDPFRPMHFYRNLGAGLEIAPSWQSAESSIQNTAVAADFDADGFLDVAVAKWVNFRSAVYRNVGGTLATTPAWERLEDDTDRGVAWGQLNADDLPDLMIGGVPSTLFVNQGDTVFSPDYQANPPFDSVQEIALIDIDQDADLDFVETHFGDGRTHVYLNRGGNLDVTPSWTFDASEVANAIALGDLNGDGWLDLAIGYSGNTSVRVFFATPICRADFNSDGQADLFDYLDFAAAFSNEESSADFNEDGQVDLFDYLDFASAFGTGCE